MTRPDRTQFFFDCDGYLTSIVDKNGNEHAVHLRGAQVATTSRPSSSRYITDPAGRQTLTLDYYAKGDTYDYIDDTTWTKVTGRPT